MTTLEEIALFLKQHKRPVWGDTVLWLRDEHVELRRQHQNLLREVLDVAHAQERKIDVRQLQAQLDELMLTPRKQDECLDSR